VSDPPEVIAVVGGSVDHVTLTLALKRVALDHDALSARLGCAPTHADADGWSLEVQGSPPALGGDDLVTLLLGRLPVDEAFWAALRRDYQVEIRVGVSMTGWNRGLELSPASLRSIRMTGAPLVFDLYALADA
jgi:hypothetical protein